MSASYREVCELRLAEPDCFPVGAGPGEQPLSLALAALVGMEEREEGLIQIVARPVTSSARRGLIRAARTLRAGRSQGRLRGWSGSGGSGRRSAPDPSMEPDVRSIMAKAASPLFLCSIRVAATSPDREAARGRIHHLAGSFSVFEGRNGFRRRRVRGGVGLIESRRLSRASFLLSATELAQIASLPAAGSFPGLDRAGARRVGPVRAVASSGKVLGRTDHNTVQRDVAITIEDARRHMHIIGETGTGKTTLVANLVLQDAAAGRAAVVIDPQGDLVESILERLPAGCEERTCLVDPDDGHHAVGLDVLAGDDHDLVVEHVLGVFRRIYEAHWGPRTEDIMRAACLTLKRIPGATLCEVPLLLTDYDWRREVSRRLRNVIGLNDFWQWYDKLPDQQRAQHIAPLLNKLRAFLLRGPVRAIIGQADPRTNVESLVGSGGLLLVRIPKGTLGEETSRLLGALVVARVWQACMKRAGVPQEQRPDTTLYVDEMHNYLALPRSFEDLLAEARGYRLSLALAHQHMGQLPREMREALGANARTKVVFVCSPEDGTVLEKHFEPELTAYDLSHLAAFQAACRPCVGGTHGPAFTLRTYPLPAGSTARAEQVRSASNRLFASSIRRVEEEMRHRHRTAARLLLPQEIEAEPRAPSPERSGRAPDRSVDHRRERSGERCGDRPSPLPPQEAKPAGKGGR